MLPNFHDGKVTQTFLSCFFRLSESGPHESKLGGTRKFFPLKDDSASDDWQYQRYIPEAMLGICVL